MKAAPIIAVLLCIIKRGFVFSFATNLPIDSCRSLHLENLSLNSQVDGSIQSKSAERIETDQVDSYEENNANELRFSGVGRYVILSSFIPLFSSSFGLFSSTIVSTSIQVVCQ